MSVLEWDKAGERLYETGVDQGVLYIPDAGGNYVNGYAWNGLVAVTESPAGAESNKQYADNQVYVNLLSAEEFNGTIEAFTSPEEFDQCDGLASPVPGVSLGQQGRKAFGFSYRTRIGNDLLGTDYGYKIHLVYGAQASPSEKNFSTINDSPEAATLSWEVSTTPVGGPAGFKPLATITIDSTKVTPSALAALEDFLYGTAGTEPQLPLPAAVVALFDGTITEVTPTEPTFDSGTDTITIPTVTGVRYTINGMDVSGAVVITEDTVVKAYPADGYVFPDVVDDDWFFDYTP